MKKVLKIIGRVLLGIAVLAVILVGVLTITEYKPENVETVITNHPAEAVFSIGEEMTLVTWNVGYGALSARIDQYVGKTLKFNVWIVSIEEIGDEWHILAAGSLTGEDHYTQQLMYIAEQEPSFSVGEKLTLYGTCTGPHYIESEESTESIPQLDLLFWD